TRPPPVPYTTLFRSEAAIAELGYRLNVSASHLRKGRTGMIGLAVPELAHPYFAEFADVIVSEAEKVGLRVLIERTGATREGALRSEEHTSELQSREN